MNSKLTDYHTGDCNYFKKENEPCPTILKCGCSGRSISVPATITTTPLVIATVGINIPKLCNPCVKIEYSSTIGFVGEAGGAEVDITITIFKNCPNNLRIPISSYRYTRTGLPGFFGSRDTFSFFACDCNTCQPNECCYYSAEITASTVTGTTVTIEGIALSALIASSNCTC